MGKRTTTAMGWLALVALAGCGETDPAYGTVGVALTAGGPNLSTYRLPAGTEVELIGDGNGYAGRFSLDGDGTALELDVPVGTYQATLVHPAGYSLTWPLDHLFQDGTAETVNAKLVSSMPIVLQVVYDTTTSLVFSFEVAGGTVAFAHGTVAVTVDVSNVGATGGTTAWDASLTSSSVSLGSLPAQIVPRLPLAGTGGLVAVVHARLSAPWFQASESQVCATVVIDELAGTGHEGFRDLLLESVDLDASLCAGSEGGQSFITFFTHRSGAGSTPTFADAGTNLSFSTLLTATLPGPIFDGQSLDLDALAGIRTLPVFARTRVREGGNGALWYDATYAGQVIFDFTPTR
jgi:hypothetical protein